MNRRTAGPLPWLLPALVAALGACGGGGAGTPDVATPADECLRDPDCDDAVDCTDDVCSLSVNGLRVCEHVPRSDRCPADSECLPDSPLGVGCVQRAALWCSGRAEGDPCLPDDACALGDGTCRAGRCQYARKECAAQACLVSRGCDAATGRCEYGAEPNGTPCESDGLACTEDRCNDSACVPVTDTCQCTPRRACPAPGDACLESARCVDGACLYDPVACPPDEPCRTWECDPLNGQCLPRPRDGGEPCDDGLSCTTGDRCQEGLCAGDPRACDDGPCRLGACAEPDGCAFADREDGLPCSDGDPCNGPDACADGACGPAGPPVDCDDGNACTADSCVAGDGDCRHDVVLDCCGNGLREAGEDCDPGVDAAPLCAGCRFATAEATSTGARPAVAWSAAARAGWIAWEAAAFEAVWTLHLRSFDRDGRLGVPAEVPDAPPGRGGRFLPTLAPLSDGRVLLAFHQGDGIGLRLLGAHGGIVGSGQVEGAVDEGQVPGNALVAGVLDDAVLLAWDAVEVGEAVSWTGVRAAWVLFAGDEVLNSRVFPVAGDRAGGLSAWPGDVCMGPEGALVTVLGLDAEASRAVAVRVGADAKVRDSREIAATPRSIRVPPRCVSLPDGTFRFAWAVAREVDGVHGMQLQAATLDGLGAMSGTPAPLVASEPVQSLYPALAALERWGDGLACVAGHLLGASLATPDAVALRLMPWSGGAEPAGAALPLEGAEDGFSLDLDLAPGPDGVLLAAWQWLDHVDTELPPSPVRLRLLAPPPTGRAPWN